MRFVVYESQTPRFALYGPTKNKEIVKSVRGFSSDTLKLCDLLAKIDIELLTDSCRRLTLQPYIRHQNTLLLIGCLILKLYSQWEHHPTRYLN